MIAVGISGRIEGKARLYTVYFAKTRFWVHAFDTLLAGWQAALVVGIEVGWVLDGQEESQG